MPCTASAHLCVRGIVCVSFSQTSVEAIPLQDLMSKVSFMRTASPVMCTVPGKATGAAGRTAGT